MIIGKHFTFEAAHKLPDKDCYGACSNMHGHSYKLTVEIEGDILPEGWVINFKTLKDIVNLNFIDKYDHAILNNFFDIPTAEVMAQYIFDTLGSILQENKIDAIVHNVTLYETANSYASINTESK